MAGRSLHISDYRKAIAEGVIPGDFADAAFTFPVVTSVNTRGAELVWQVRVHLEDEAGNVVPFRPGYLAPGADTPAGVWGVITTQSHQVSKAGVQGKVRAGGKPTHVKAGKNLGKKNATNPVTQALRMALSKHRAQVRRGEKGSKKSKYDCPPPMLVKKLGETRKATLTDKVIAELGVTVQRKYNGVRAPCFLADDGKVVFYSRTGLEYPGLEKLRAELAPALKRAPPGPKGSKVYLDGELYVHGKSLREISGLARGDGDADELQYMVYDCFFPKAKEAGCDTASGERQTYLDEFFEATPGLANVRRAENFPVDSLEEVFELRDRFLGEAYEGAIARKDTEGYQYGVNNYHSSNLVKIKPIYDAEFVVVGYTEGKGKDRGSVIWECEVDPEHVVKESDKKFRVVPKNMTNAQRKQIYRQLSQKPWGGAGPTVFEKVVRGRQLTVEFPERSTKTGKPTQAKALNFRCDSPGSTDPLVVLGQLAASE